MMRLLVLSLVALLSSLPLAGGNAMPNPGLEEGKDGQATGWTVPKKVGTRFSLDGETAHTGKRSLRVDGLDPEAQDRYVQAWRLTLPLPKEDDLWLTGWAKGTELTTGRVNVLHMDKDGKVLQNQSVASFSGTFSWRQFGQRLASVPGAVSIQLVMGLQHSKGTIWFDDLYLGGRTEKETGSLVLATGNRHPAGETVPAVFVFTLGEGGLAPGGEVALQWDNWRTCREYAVLKPQAECSMPGAVLELRRPPRKKSWPPTRRPVDTVVAVKGDRALPAGAEIRVKCQLRFSRKTNVHAGIFGTFSGVSGAIPGSTGIIVLEPQGGEAAQLRCIAESRPVAGQAGRMVVALVDAAGNPATGFVGTVGLVSQSGVSLPAEYTFTADDGGSHEFAATCPAGQVTRIRVRWGDQEAVSNPILPRAADEPGIFFGDIHCHCEVSADAVGSPEDAYDYARRFQGMDFAALSDHSPRAGKWERAMAAAEQCNVPGRFATLLGFEWSDARMGHRNIYYPGAEGPEQPRLATNTDAWFKWLAEKQVAGVVIPHHTNTEAAQIKANGKPAWQRCDWSVINHEYQRVVEICQNRGSFEAPDGPNKELRIARKDVGASVQTALAMGHRLGFIGSTDDHSGRPGSGPARVAIVTGSSDRASLWRGLHDRSCYATTGCRTLVFLHVNDAPMGSELVLPKGSPRTVTWRAIGTGPIRRVDLLRSNEVVQSWSGTGDDMSATFRYPAPLAAGEWWYLRVIQEDANLAWSSPVWVDPQD